MKRILIVDTDGDFGFLGRMLLRFYDIDSSYTEDIHAVRSLIASGAYDIVFIDAGKNLSDIIQFLYSIQTQLKEKTTILLCVARSDKKKCERLGSFFKILVKPLDAASFLSEFQEREHGVGLEK